MSSLDNRLAVFAPAPDAKLLLYALAHAGAGVAPFYPWTGFFTTIELRALRLPGRESRASEEPLDDLACAAEEIASTVKRTADRPYALFGRCSGARVMFEVAKRLRASARPNEPHLRGLYVYEQPPPNAVVPIDVDSLDGEALWELVGGAGGTPPELLANAQFRAVMEGVIRADFALAGCVSDESAGTIDVPIIVLSAAAGSVVPDGAAGWAPFTRVDTRSITVPGSHFPTPCAWRAIGVRLQSECAVLAVQ
jgi:medium-chain acyl-[acyl-carrier-protein] hydrolase